MTYRSSPAFAIGGVSWLGPSGKPTNIVMPPEGRWRCFICNEVFTDVGSAFRHFGVDSKVPPRCEEVEFTSSVIVAAHRAARSLHEGGGPQYWRVRLAVCECLAGLEA